MVPPSEFSNGTPETKYQEAIGYYQLGMLDECEELVAGLNPDQIAKSQVVELQMLIAMDRTEWQTASEFADTLLEIANDERSPDVTHLTPDQLRAYLHKAFVLHELKQTEVAYRLLVDAEADVSADAPLMEAEGTLFFNLACYASVIGQLPASRDYLSKAVSRNPKFMDSAKMDPDLKALRAFDPSLF